jgi:hypothetical protein
MPLAGYRLLVTGSRYWTNVEKIYDVLSLAKEQAGALPLIIVEGEAKGADELSRRVAHQLELDVERYPADWNAHGKAAGPIRNQQMLDESLRRAHSDGCYLRAGAAFHESLADSKGTLDMVNRLEAAGIPVLRIS